MDLQTLLIMLILASVVTMLVRTMVKGLKRKPMPKQASSKKRQTSSAFALDDALDKINETIRILQEDLGPRAPGRHDPAGAKFYIAYMVGITREVGRMNDVDGNIALETPIRMEMIRLGMSTKNGAEGFHRLMMSNEGQQGLAAGELDGRDACNRNYRGVYFERIKTYFQDAEVRGPR